MVLIFLSVVCSSSSIWRGISILHAAFYAILFMHQKQADVPIAKWCILAQKEGVLCWDYFPKAYCKPVKRKTPESYLPSKTKTCKSSGCLESDSQNWLRKLREVLNPKPSIWNPKPSKFAVGCRLFEWSYWERLLLRRILDRINETNIWLCFPCKTSWLI